jgi:hypothetical protein
MNPMTGLEMFLGGKMRRKLIATSRNKTTRELHFLKK